MYYIAKNNLDMRQSTSKTYYDKKDPKWIGPCEVKGVGEYIFEIEIITKTGSIRKWIPRDRLKLVNKSSNIDIISEDDKNLSSKVNVRPDSDSESEEEPQVPHRYNLREQRQPANYHVNLF